MGYLELSAIVLASLFSVIYGAKILVDGSVALAKKSGIREFVIGLVIVGVGTSAPEMVVSLSAAIQGNPDISMGNIIGSNIYNVLLILGITSLFYPIYIKKDNDKDVLFNFFATCLALLCILGPNLMTLIKTGNMDFQMRLTRIEGLIFLAGFAYYMISSFRSPTPDAGICEETEIDETKFSNIKIAIMIITGLAMLIIGGHYFVDSSVMIADKLGFSHKFIAITLIAGGTSLPELATCIVAAYKKEGQLALGNILGSNVFNLLLILGASSTIKDLNASSITGIDFTMLFISTLPIMAAAYLSKQKKMGRGMGAIMLLIFALYIAYLFIMK